MMFRFHPRLTQQTVPALHPRPKCQLHNKIREAVKRDIVAFELFALLSDLV